MGLVNDWILGKLGLPVYNDSLQFRRGISNGYIIAEILRKYGIISDDQLLAFGHTFTEATKMRNMKFLYKWMSAAGLSQFTMTHLLDIAEEKPGAAVSFLYMLYYTIEVPSGEWAALKKRHKKDSQAFQKKFQPKVALDEEDEDEEEEEEEELFDFASAFDPDVEPAMQTIDEFRSQLLLAAEAMKMTVVDPNTEKKKSIKQSSPECSQIDGHEDFLETMRQVTWAQEMCKGDTFHSAEGLMMRDDGDTKEAVRLYFASRAKDNHNRILREQSERVRLPRIVPQRTTCLTPTDVQNNDWLSAYQQVDFSGLPDQVELERMKAKVEQEARVMKEMEIFDDLVREKRDNKLLPAARLAEPIRTNVESMKARIRSLQAEKKRERNDEEERILLGSSIAKRMWSQTQVQIEDSFLEMVLGKTQELPSKEGELSDFLINTYRSKALFLDHASFEEAALREWALQRQDRLSVEKGRMDENERAMRNLEGARVDKMEGDRNQNELQLILNIINRLLTMALRLAFRIAEYREVNRDEQGEAQDPPQDLIDEWKAWLLLGLETPPPEEEEESSESLEMPEYDLFDGHCHITLSANPIPLELNPRLFELQKMRRSEARILAEGEGGVDGGHSSSMGSFLQDGEEGEEEEDFMLNATSSATLRVKGSTTRSSSKRFSSGQPHLSSSNNLNEGGLEEIGGESNTPSPIMTAHAPITLSSISTKVSRLIRKSGLSGTTPSSVSVKSTAVPGKTRKTKTNTNL